MRSIDGIIKFLSNLGLNVDQSKIYLTLLDYPGITILQLSRESRISRTNVYRLVEDLKEIGLLEEIMRDNKRLLYPVGTHKLELIVKEQESKADFLRKILPELTSLITSSESITQPGTKIQVYKGVEGIKQMVWNTLRCNKEVIGYTFRSLKEIVGEKFESDWREEFIKRNLVIRDLVSDSYLASLAGESVKELEYSNHFRTKYLSKTVLDINHQVDIYNDVLAFYLWYDTEIFGVEIYNKKISDMQKQLFELAWDRASDV